jgi:arylsulfatase A-like enzyme
MEGNSLMNRRDFIKSSALAAMATGLNYPANAKGRSAAGVPNMIFIHVDQMSLLDSISAYGSKFTKTPGIDRLVENGVSFMQSYSTDPVCCPARASWFTGSYSSENGVVCNSAPCHPEMPDVSRQLQDAGYNTYYTGKWHVPGKEVRDLFHVLHEGSWWGEITDTEVTRTATSFLENYNSDEPFFLSVGYMNPHDICISPMYDDARATKVNGVKEPPYFKDGVLEQSDVPPLPDAFEYDPRESGVMQLTKRRKYKDWGDDMWRIYRYNYHRFTEMVDLQIEQLLDALAQTKFADDTLIIFSSDHGDGMARHHSVAKATPYDEVCRVPFIVASLGDLKVPKGVKDEAHLISGVDLGRTLCDYARGDGSVFPQGLSLRPLVEGRTVPWREMAYVEVNASMHLATDGKIKYVREYVFNEDFASMPPSHQTHETGVEQLFDLSADPDESRNLAYDPEYAPVLKRMRAELDRLEDERQNVKAVAAFPQKVMRDRAAAIQRQGIPQSY